MKTMNAKGTEIQITSYTSDAQKGLTFDPSGGFSAHIDAVDLSTCNQIAAYLTENDCTEVHVEKSSAHTFAHLILSNGDVENRNPVDANLMTLAEALWDRIDTLTATYETYLDSLNEPTDEV